MYVWHKEAKSKKFKVIIELPSAYQVLLDHHFQHLPKAEYEECPPPEPLRMWKDVTRELDIHAEGLIARLPENRGVVVLNPYIPNPTEMKLVKHDGALYLKEFR
jgi:hypothetical protein